MPPPRASGLTNRSFITAIREPLNVDQVQKIVAKPSARPSSSRAISCVPSRSGLAISSRERASSSASEGFTS